MTTERDPIRFSAREWLMLLMLAAIHFTHIVDFMIVMPLGPQLREQLGLSPAEFGHVVSAYAAAAAMAGLVAALGIDRLDRKVALLVIYAAFTVATLLCGVANGYYQLLAGRLAAGATGGIAGAVVLAIVGDAFRDGRRGTATGVVMAAFSVATVVGIPAGLAIAQSVNDWRKPFLVLGGLSVLVLVGAWAVLPPMRGHLAGPSRAPGLGLARLAGIVTNPGYLPAFAMMVLLMSGGFMVIPFISPFLVGNGYLSQDQLIYIYLCGGAATFFTMPLIGWLSDRFGKKRLFQVVAVLSLGPLLTMTHLPTGLSLAAVVVVGTLMFVTLSGRGVPAIALVTGVALPGDRGSFMSVMASMQQLAAAGAVEVAGMMLAKGSGHAILHYDRVGWLAAGFTLLGVWMAGAIEPAPEVVPVVVTEPLPEPATTGS
jgi:DHA1 family inner membrane transport protein